MNIIILGAGQVGATLAENLVSEENDVSVVDINGELLRELQSKLDIRTVEGPASYPDILSAAGAEDADMLIAVTSSDEANMVACQAAFSLFRIPTKIARIRAPQYLVYKHLFGNEAMPIDVFISPEQLVTNYVKRLIEYPGALQVLDFAKDKLQLVAVRPYYGGVMVGKKISAVTEHMPGISVRIVAIYRGNRCVDLSEDTVIEVGDEVFFLTAASDITAVLGALRRLDNPNKRIIIAGGGNIGFRLAKSLESDFQIKILEHNAERSEFLANSLKSTTVLSGDACDRDLLLDESIEYTDVFCALTNDDEANILSCMQAKRLGARQVMALVTRTAYADLIEGSDIDIAISPQQSTIGSILTHIRRGDVVSVHSLRRGAAEAIEVIAHGDKETAKVVGRKLSEIKLPPGTLIGAILRGEQLIFKVEDQVIENNDHIILFLTDKKRIKDVEKLFQVNVNFFA